MPDGRTRVLIVEDDAEIRRLYAIALNQRGFEVRLASNGAEAIERLGSEKPDVILLDWIMPLMDGAEVVRRLTESGAGGVPIIVISGHPRPVVSKPDPRIVCWLTKPVSIPQLVTAIQRPFAVS